jgi:hypothetical protein
MSVERNLRSGLGLLYSKTSLNSCVQAAKQPDAIYNFQGTTGWVRWLKGEYAYLAPNGAASLLRRLCIKFDWLSDEEIEDSMVLQRYHTLILPHAVALTAQTPKALSTWVEKGGHLLVSGRTCLPLELLGLSRIKWYQPEGYSAIRYRKYDLIAGYRGYTIGIGQPASGSQILASACEVLNPAEGISNENDSSIGPAVIQNGKVLYITLPLFETFGAMLQGQVNFEDMRVWGHRYKYLDWVCRCVKDLLEEAGWSHLWTVRVKPWGEYHGVVVLRHDVDESTDTTYLNYERKNHIPATYAILDDQHRKYWLNAVATHPEAEAAYHFDTSPEMISRFDKLLYRFKAVTLNVSNKTDGNRLWKQMKKARDSLGIPILTAQRHNSVFHYPEIVDAMNYLYKLEPEVLGLGTMFRFTNFMFGARTKEDDNTYVVEHPDTSTPFWFPYKLWYASADHHHMLRGWDITHVLEPEPWLTEHLLDQAEYLDDGVYTLGFHPAHCRGKSFRPEGNWQWFEYAVDLGHSRGYLFATCREVFERMNHWEYLGFGFHHGEGWLSNQQFYFPVTVYLEHPQGSISFKKTNSSPEFLRPTLTKIVLGAGELIYFSIG